MPWRLAAVALAALALARPAGAEVVTYECKISQSTSGGVTTVFDDAARERPELRERFAFNVAAGRGCIIVGDTCDAKIGRLEVEQDESSIIARSRTAPLMLTYMLARQEFVLIAGDNSLWSRQDDCHRISLDPSMP